MKDKVNVQSNNILDFEEKKIKDLSNLQRNQYLNDQDVYDVLSKNSTKIFFPWTKLQQAWCSNAFAQFKDYDTYLILIYLIQQVLYKYSERYEILSIDEFYDKTEIQLEKINLIEISKDLNIPKETVRRKVNFLQKENVLYRNGKAIFFNAKFGLHQRPQKSKEWLCKYLYIAGSILAKEEWFGKNFSEDEIMKFIEKYFTTAWHQWFKLQIPFLVRKRTFFGDLETFNVWGSIGLAQLHDYNQDMKKNIIENPKNFNDLYLNFLDYVPKNGINASSISDISSIPRATVIRKLKILVKEKFIKKNKNLEYIFYRSKKNLLSFEKNYLTNQKKIAHFVAIFFDLMKSPKFKL